MRNFKNRIPALEKANRKKITLEDGNSYYAFVETADDGEDGTPINRETMMALQGMDNCTTEFLADGSIKETYGDGSFKTVTFQNNGNITETYEKDGQIITKQISFLANGNIKEVVL